MTVSMAIFALLKIAILLSTGLLALQNTTLTKHDVPIFCDGRCISNIGEEVVCDEYINLKARQAP
jgi:hypothetical protein